MRSIQICAGLPSIPQITFQNETKRLVDLGGLGQATEDGSIICIKPFSKQQVFKLRGYRDSR
jgi:hypothetical protein